MRCTPLSLGIVPVMSRNWRKLLHAAVFSAVVASACGFSDGGSSPTRSSIAASSPAAESASDTAKERFNLTANVIGGGSVVLDDELTRRPVALWFWAPG